MEEEPGIKWSPSKMLWWTWNLLAPGARSAFHGEKVWLHSRNVPVAEIVAWLEIQIAMFRLSTHVFSFLCHKMPRGLEHCFLMLLLFLQSKRGQRRRRDCWRRHSSHHFATTYAYTRLSLRQMSRRMLNGYVVWMQMLWWLQMELPRRAGGHSNMPSSVLTRKVPTLKPSRFV